MNLNPELQRQFYLEYSPARLIGIPLALWLLFTLCYYIDGYQLGSASARTAFTLFLIITLIWGARQSMNSIMEEFRERTWDIQRLSAIEPWTLVWGKLLGSNMMVWYGGLLCLIIYSLATPDGSHLPIVWFYCLGTGLTVQSISLLIGQLAAQRGQIKAGALFLPIIIGFFYIASKFSSITAFSEAGNDLFSDNQRIIWYGMSFDSHLFYHFSLLLALFWSCVGNYRFMAQELGIRSLPWAWIAFNFCLMIYLAGYFSSEYSITLTAFLVTVVLTYLSLITEPDIARQTQNLFRYAKLKAWQRFAEEMPLWCISFVLSIPTALHLSLSTQPLTALTSLFHFYPLPILLLLLRDCSLFLYFNLEQNSRHAVNRTLLILAMLYAIIPGILSFTGISWLATLFFPLWANSESTALVAALFQIFVLAYLLFLRIKLALMDGPKT
ncbi:ABC transporter permease [Methylomonas sp. AM2-LC]|uniref:ABC transporter permease n=1 Tax=Methylomonas sp. AM2-LC TaxID=3153301 RepID=UPI003267920A